MKQVLLSLITLALLTTLGCSSCKKEIVIDNGGLPPTTQTGANTLGFTLNGQPWTPKGQVGVSANLAVNVDFGYNKGIFGITAYRYVSNSKDNFGIGLSDSLNFFTAPFSLPITNTGLCRLYYSNDLCTFFSTDVGTYVSGTLSVNKLDKSLQIISGTFNGILYKQGCDSIKITDGRFDMKY